MPVKNRADLINKLYKVVKKEYTPILPPSNRTVLEHAIYACCLEDSTSEAADEAFAKLQENFFDWNEVRVTTNKELAETVKKVTHPTEAAQRVKKLLYGVFETYYQFDLDFLRKENLSKALAAFEKMIGVTPFVISYLAQHGLGGHSIPLDKSLLELMQVVGVISESEAAKHKVPGLERTIAKSKGVEFASLAHQLAVAFHRSPFSNNVRNTILKVAADAKDRFPKRGAKKPAAAATAETKSAPPKKAAVKKDDPKTETSTKKKAAAKKPAAASTATKKTAATKKKAAVKKKTATEKAPAKKTPTKKSPTKTASAKKTPVKKAAAKKASVKKTPTKKTPTKKATKKATAKKTPAKALAKKKPR